MGRAFFFVLYDTEAESFEVLDNWQSRTCEHWAGSQTAKLLIQHRAGAVIAWRVGPCAFRHLTSAGLPIYLVDPMRVVDAIRRYREGEFQKAEAPNCTGHTHNA